MTNGNLICLIYTHAYTTERQRFSTGIKVNCVCVISVQSHANGILWSLLLTVTQHEGKSVFNILRKTLILGHFTLVRVLSIPVRHSVKPLNLGRIGF